MHYVGDQAHVLSGVPCAKWWGDRDVADGSNDEGRSEAVQLGLMDAAAAADAEEVPPHDVFALAPPPYAGGGASGDDLAAESSLAAIECPAMRTLVLRLAMFVRFGTHTLRRRAAAALGKIALRAQEPTRLALYATLAALRTPTSAVADVVVPFVEVLDLLYAELSREEELVALSHDSAEVRGARWEALRTCARVVAHWQ